MARWPVDSALAVLAVATLTATLPTTALATPLAESEPNNDALNANGPFGIDEWTQTSDDIYYVLFRPQGRRQVALTASGLSNCGYPSRA
jgi:hypothetical protein